ncbi:MAG: hypothetical protein FJX36_18000 [Alphaproteobacteria bacterium]|nr:hypothetical protein [Alphaproteobacteria bacterium]
MTTNALPPARRHQHWTLSKSARHSQNGIVVAASAPAAEIGARILAEEGKLVASARLRVSPSVGEAAGVLLLSEDARADGLR